MIDTSLEYTEGVPELGEQRISCTVRPVLIGLSRVAVFLAALMGVFSLVPLAGACGLVAPVAGVQDAGTLIAGTVVVLFCLASGIYLLVWGNHYQNWRVLICDHGLLHEDRGRATVYRWEDIKEFRQAFIQMNIEGLPMQGYRCWVTKETGEQFEIYSFYHRHAQACGLAIHQQTLPLLLRRARSLIQEGQPAAFGPIGISEEGITYKGRTLAWDEVESVKIEAGVLQVKKKSAWLLWYKGQISDIPNSFVFTALIDEKMAVPAATNTGEAPPTKDRWGHFLLAGVLLLGPAALLYFFLTAMEANGQVQQLPGWLAQVYLALGKWGVIGLIVLAGVLFILGSILMRRDPPKPSDGKHRGVPATTDAPEAPPSKDRWWHFLLGGVLFLGAAPLVYFFLTATEANGQALRLPWWLALVYLALGKWGVIGLIVLVGVLGILLSILMLRDPPRHSHGDQRAQERAPPLFSNQPRAVRPWRPLSD